MSQSFEKLLAKFAKWVDPKLEPYRQHKKMVYTPQTVEDLVGVLQRAPKEVLSKKERNTIAAAMSFNQTLVKDLMLPREEMTVVHEDDYLGPLMLDKLYKSGSSHFPVLSKKGQVVGVLHTKQLNSLEIRETDQARKYLDHNIYYMREDYSLAQAFTAFLRTNCYFFIVVDRVGTDVGLLDLETLIGYLLGGEKPRDDFDQDSDLYAVSHRVIAHKP